MTARAYSPVAQKSNRFWRGPDNKVLRQTPLLTRADLDEMPRNWYSCILSGGVRALIPAGAAICEYDDRTHTSVGGSGEKIWEKDGRLHRENDKPAVIFTDGEQRWYTHGKLHREGDSPAVIYAAGHRLWFLFGNLHRGGDKPALVMADGRQEWHQFGRLHRGGDLPAVIHADGTKEWYLDGKRHRAGNKPAIIFADGRQAWYRDGKLRTGVRTATPASLQ